MSTSYNLTEKMGHGPFIRVMREEFSRRGVSIWLGERLHDGYAYAKEVIVHKEDETVPVTSPTMHIANHAAQLLMDDLWQAGLRPSEGSGSAGALRAVERHLADMQKIAFSQLKIPNSDR